MDPAGGRREGRARGLPRVSPTTTARWKLIGRVALWGRNDFGLSSAFGKLPCITPRPVFSASVLASRCPHSFCAPLPHMRVSYRHARGVNLFAARTIQRRHTLRAHHRRQRVACRLNELACGRMYTPCRIADSRAGWFACSIVRPHCVREGWERLGAVPNTRPLRCVGRSRSIFFSSLSLTNMKPCGTGLAIITFFFSS